MTKYHNVNNQYNTGNQYKYWYVKIYMQLYTVSILVMFDLDTGIESTNHFISDTLLTKFYILDCKTESRE